MRPLVYNDDGRMITQEEYEQIHNNDASVPVDDPVMGLFVPFFEKLGVKCKVVGDLSFGQYVEKQEIYNHDGWIYIPYLILDTNYGENPEFVSKMENMLKSSTNTDIFDQMEQYLKGKYTTSNKVWELEDTADENSKFHVVIDAYGNPHVKHDRYVLKLHMTDDVRLGLINFSNNTDLYYKLATIITDISILMKMLVETFEGKKKEYHLIIKSESKISGFIFSLFLILLSR